MNDFIYRIATLGDKSGESDSERAAKYFRGGFQKLSPYTSHQVMNFHYAIRANFGREFSGIRYEEMDRRVKIDLHGSFEDALIAVREGRAEFGVVAAAYNHLFRLHCQFRDLDMSYTFPLATKEIVLAKKSTTDDIRTVALHPTTECLLQYTSHVPKDVKTDPIPNKPLCIQEAADGKVDAAIGSKDVAEQHGLVIVESFGEIPMSWEVFGRRR